MGYLLKASVGAAMFLGGIVLFNLKLLALLDTGTCVSGNVPYEIAPGYECPSGTGSDIVLLTASVFIGLLGAAIFAFRGSPPWGGGRRNLLGAFGFGSFAWGLFFVATGATALIAGFGDESLGADAELGAKIVGFTFLAMGLPALLIAVWSSARGLTGRGRDERPGGAAALAGTAPDGALARMRHGLAQASGAQQIGQAMGWSRLGSASRGTRGGDVISRIERLQKLRESDALTQEEFEREKAKALAEQ